MGNPEAGLEEQNVIKRLLCCLAPTEVREERETWNTTLSWG